MENKNYWEQIKDIRDTAKNEMRAIFARHEGWDCTNLFGDFTCNACIVMDSDTDDGIYTLDRVICTDGAISFDASNSYDSYEFPFANVSVENILSILDQLVELEGYLFSKEYAEND